MVKQVETYLPYLVQAAGCSTNAKDGLIWHDTIARLMKNFDLATCIFRQTSDFVDAGDHACLAREILHFTGRVVDAQDEARQIDVGHVFGDEVIQAVIGYAQHDCSLITNYSIPSNMLR